jgi:hypothetical protein
LYLLVAHVWIVVTAALAISASLLASGRLLSELYRSTGPPFRSARPFLINSIAAHQSLAIGFVSFVFVYLLSWLALAGGPESNQDLQHILGWVLAGAAAALSLGSVVILLPTLEQRRLVQLKRDALKRYPVRAGVATLSERRSTWMTVRAMASQALIDDQLRPWYATSLFFGSNVVIQVLSVAALVATVQQSFR